jgi:S-(hydroxymethyl)glutathione dehydrogenase/alcohol dehydrogenase
MPAIWRNTSPASSRPSARHKLGSKMGDVVIQRDIPWLIDLYQQGRLKLDELISGRWRWTRSTRPSPTPTPEPRKRNVIVFD